MIISLNVASKINKKNNKNNNNKINKINNLTINLNQYFLIL